MSHLKKAILTTNKTICANIESFGENQRGLLSQNILSQLRTLLEHISLFLYSSETGKVLSDTYSDIQVAKKYISSQGKFKIIRIFHHWLQQVVSHFTPDSEDAERLMLKYYEYLLKVKLMLKKYDIEILQNIGKFPLQTDASFQEYYGKIAEKLEEDIKDMNDLDNERYYIQKIKPFFIKQKIFFEITFIPCNDHENKFNRIIGFSRLNIVSNYAVKFKIRDTYIETLNHKMPIKIIENWMPAIRDCEIKHLGSFFGMEHLGINKKEYTKYMNILKEHECNLLDIVMSEEFFDSVVEQCCEGVGNPNISKVLQKCREIVVNNSAGSNILRYLLYNLNNRIVRKQRGNAPCPLLSGLKISWGAIPFEQIPFNTSLIDHNPSFYDVINAIDCSDFQEQILAHTVKNNTEQKDKIYTKIKEIEPLYANYDIPSLAESYNNKLYYKHRPNRELIIYKGNIFIYEYEYDVYSIIKHLQEFADYHIQNYASSTKQWLDNTKYSIDCEEKRDYLIRMFERSSIALIYGPAGTGKSTLINHISHRFAESSKLYLTQTNPAMNNLIRKITAPNVNFMTITKFILKQEKHKCDIVFIDESSTVSNSDMLKVLEKLDCSLLVLVGDVYQIDSILFGNWFNIAKSLMPANSIIELTKPYRTQNNKLLALWEMVRKVPEGNNILEIMTKEGYTCRFDETLFVPSSDDEIILCLNYDGLYGINNLNRLLQEFNPQSSFVWEGQQYKIGDPILFNNSERFAPLIYNNMKGKIVGIKPEGNKIYFTIEINKYIDEIQAHFHNLSVIGYPNKEKTQVLISVNKYKNYDEDNADNFSTIIPFQVAYAVSIHKAQGLEYDSVKLVITESMGERITHDIFYTAITRTRNKLKIYWTPETERKILSNLKPKSAIRDQSILVGRFPDLKK